MNWQEISKYLGVFGLGATSITAIIIYFSKKIFENQISIFKSEHIYRFTTLYTEKMTVIKETYKRIIKTEKSLSNLMTPDNKEVKQSLLKIAVESLDSLFDYTDENELFLDETIISLTNELKGKFEEVLKAYNNAEFMENMRGTESWANAIENKMRTTATVLDREIPMIKKNLKQEFQKKL